MTNYLQERARKRLVVSSVLMVVAFCLQWSGVLRMASVGNDAVNRMVLSSYDMVVSESVMVSFANKLASDWMAILGGSATMYALVFASLIWVAWALLPRRLMAGVAAVGMFSTLALGLPFLPAQVFVKASTGHELSYYMGDKAAIEDTEVVVPLSGVVPFFDISAFADESAGVLSVPEVYAEDTGRPSFGMYEQSMIVALQAVQFLNVLIGVGFWSVLGGLAYLTFASARAEESEPAGS